MTTANMITFLRLILSIVFITSFIKQSFPIALIAFIVGALTDGIDGFIARKMNETTEIGRIIDPLCDKLLIDSGFILLSLYGTVPIWLSFIVIMRDILILCGSLTLMVQGKLSSIRPMYIGKVTAFLQFVTIAEALFVVNNVNIWWVLKPTCILTGVSTIVSGLAYAYRGIWDVKKVFS